MELSIINNNNICNVINQLNIIYSDVTVNI